MEWIRILKKIIGLQKKLFRDKKKENHFPSSRDLRFFCDAILIELPLWSTMLILPKLLLNIPPCAQALVTEMQLDFYVIAFLEKCRYAIKIGTFKDNLGVQDSNIARVILLVW